MSRREAAYLLCIIGPKKFRVLRKFMNKKADTNVYINEDNRFQKLLKSAKERVK